MAGSNGHGGARENSGRKGLAEEMGLPGLIMDVIGEEGKRTLIEKLWEGAKEGNFLKQQLLMNYMFGKPKDSMDITSKGQQIETFKEIVFRNYAEDKP